MTTNAFIILLTFLKFVATTENATPFSGTSEYEKPAITFIAKIFLFIFSYFLASLSSLRIGFFNVLVPEGGHNILAFM